MIDAIRRTRLFWLGIILITIGILALVPLYFYDVPNNNKEILAMGIGVILGWGSSAVTYYFASDNDKTLGT